MLSKLKDRLAGIGLGLLIGSVAIAGAVAMPATAQQAAGGPVASASQGVIQHVKRALQLGRTANRRSVQGIRIARAAHQQAGEPGPQGPAGDDGATGPTGPQGPAGEDGADGQDGADGEDGQDGADGESVEVIAGAGGCPAGGTTVQVEGEPGTAEEVCDGEKGDKGDPGDPWTAGGTLPSGEMLTGAWAGRTAGVTAVGISFPLPLDNPLDETQVHMVDSNGDAIGGGSVPECPGTTAAPDAQAGNLCVYQGARGEPTSTRTPSGDGTTAGADVSGTRLVAATDSSDDLADGTWAVRAP